MNQMKLCKVGDFGLLRKTTKDDGENYSYNYVASKVAS